MADPSPIDRIEELVSEEHRLWAESERDQLDEAAHRRLEEIRGELDRCWDALRRRRAHAPEADRSVPFPPNELEGPEPEPPHLEHGLHGEGPAPDPDEPRDIP